MLGEPVLERELPTEEERGPTLVVYHGENSGWYIARNRRLLAHDETEEAFRVSLAREARAAYCDLFPNSVLASGSSNVAGELELFVPASVPAGESVPLAKREASAALPRLLLHDRSEDSCDGEFLGIRTLGVSRLATATLHVRALDDRGPRPVALSHDAALAWMLSTCIELRGEPERVVRMLAGVVSGFESRLWHGAASDAERVGARAWRRDFEMPATGSMTRLLSGGASDPAQARPRSRPGCRRMEVAGGDLLLNPDHGVPLFLDAQAARVARALDGATSLADIARSTRNGCGPARSEAELIQLVDVLSWRALIATRDVEPCQDAPDIAS